MKTYRMAIALSLVIAATLSGAPAQARPAATVLNAGTPNSVPDSYVVTLPKETGDVAAAAQRLADRYGGTVGHTYDTVLKGFSVNTSATAAQRLAADPGVVRVEQDITGHTTSSRQVNPPSWGLDRIDRHNVIRDFTYRYHFRGTGVRVYILDMGIRITHSQFGGRAEYGFDATSPGGTPTDSCVPGHGTHVAGTVAASTYGVAKATRVVAVRVIDCTDQAVLSEVLAGVEWVTDDHVARGTPAVANASFRILGNTPSVNDAIEASIASGVTWVVAAGNDGNDACTVSPARVPAAITVASTTDTDARDTTVGIPSNFGPCVDLFAPGNEIVSLSNSNDTDTRVKSGTSMAAPHVAGAAAMILQQHPTWTPAQVRNAIVNSATTGRVTNRGTGSPNRLLYAWVGPVVPTDGSVCDTRVSRITCFVTSEGTPISTVRWTVDGQARPNWDDLRSIQFGCTPGTTYAVRVTIADAAGLDDARTEQQICRSGNP
jgi:subtilisin family serine protease